ncbi:MAG TPA: hypothetical protein VII76_06135 [Acidimicrobiales bacterium]
MRRKILMGVLALALPAGLMATMSTTAVAAKAPPNPIACSGFGGTVTFGEGLSVAGTPTSAKVSNPTTVSGGSFTCTGAVTASNGGITITGSKNAKLAKSSPFYNKTTGVKYLTGTKASFTAAGGTLKKTLKIINFTIGGHAEQFKTKGASEIIGGVCGADVGFKIVGQVKAAPYDTKTAFVLACLGHDTGPGTTNSIGVDLFNSSTLLTGQIDPAVSNAVL